MAAFVCGDEEAAMMYWSLKLHEFPDSPSCCALKLKINIMVTLNLLSICSFLVGFVLLDL